MIFCRQYHTDAVCFFAWIPGNWYLTICLSVVIINVTKIPERNAFVNESEGNCYEIYRI